MSTSSGDHEAPLMAAVNEAIDRLHSSLDLANSDFFCECGHIGCKERITLSRGEYAGLLEESRPLLAAAHVARESAADTELRTLRGQVHQLQGTLASRVNIEQAKSVLVERHGMTPDDAFQTLRQRARDQRRSLDEVCAQIISWAGIPDGGGSEPAPSAADRRRMKCARGDNVWVRGRAGTFQGVYRDSETALVRYAGEQEVRVVRLERVALSKAESLQRAIPPTPRRASSQTPPTLQAVDESPGTHANRERMRGGTQALEG